MEDKFIDFIITQSCSYSCTYCSQSKKENLVQNSADEKILQCFLNFLKTLDNDFIITITGGEALLHSNFYEFIEEIKNMGFKINLITNFSFEIEK